MKLINLHNPSNSRSIFKFFRDDNGELSFQEDNSFYPYYYEEDSSGIFTGYLNGKKYKKVFVPTPSDVRRQASPTALGIDIPFTKNYILDNIQTLAPVIPRICFMDLEVKTDSIENCRDYSKPIISIAIYDSFTNKDYVWYAGDLCGTLNQRERIIINSFCAKIKELKPDIMAVWFGNQFDIPYLQARDRYWARKASCVSLERYGYRTPAGEFIKLPVGCAVIDLMEYYRKYTLNKWVTYNLHDVLVREFGKGKTYHEVDFNKLTNDVKERNRGDVLDLVRLEQKHNVIEFFNQIRLETFCDLEELQSITSFSKGEYQHRSNNSRMFDTALLRESKKRKIVLPNKPSEIDFKKLDGAERETFECGRFKNAFKDDLGCVCQDTEILTTAGWRTYKTVKKTDTLITFNMRTKFLEHKKINKIFKSHYTGMMYHFVSKNTDQLLTPNHQVIRRVKNRKNQKWPEWNFCRADSYFPSVTQLPLASLGYRDGKPYAIKNCLLKLLAWVLTEGSFNGNQIVIYQSESSGPFVNEIHELLKENKMDFYIYTRNRSGNKEYAFVIRRKSADKINVILNKKKFLPSWIYTMSFDQLNIFFNELLKGDGVKTVGKMAYFCCNPMLAEQVAILGILCGYKTSIHKKKSLTAKSGWYYNIFFSQQSKNITYYRAKNPQLKINQVMYTGIVWCVNSDNNTIICRRNNKVFITGNSAYPYAVYDFCLDPVNLRPCPGQNTISIPVEDRVTGKVTNTYHIEQDRNALIPYVVKQGIIWKEQIKTELGELDPSTKQAEAMLIKYNAAKAILNSYWGSIALVFFRLFNINISRIITFIPRKILYLSYQKLLELKARPILRDTDSYVYCSDKSLTDELNKTIKDWFKSFGLKETNIEFNSEGKFLLIFTVAKCHYIGLLENKKGRKWEKKGIEAVSNAYSKYVKHFQLELLQKRILEQWQSEKEVLSWIVKERKNIKSLSLYDIGIPAKVNHVDYKKEKIQNGKVVKLDLPYRVRAFNNANKCLKKKIDFGELFYIVKMLPPIGYMGFKHTTDHIERDKIDWQHMLALSIDNKAEKIFEIMNWDYNITGQLELSF